MEYEKIKQLMDDMGNSKLIAIDIDFPDGTKISMKKEIKQDTIIIGEELQNKEQQIQNIQVKEQLEQKIKQIQNKEQESKIVEKQEKEQIGNLVKSPMVGTFYAKSSPTAETYVEIGKTVKKGDILCIIEAMKLMNEIESEFSGEVVEIFVKDGDTVEYGTPLFRIK